MRAAGDSGREKSHGAHIGDALPEMRFEPGGESRDGEVAVFAAALCGEQRLAGVELEGDELEMRMWEAEQRRRVRQGDAYVCLHGGPALLRITTEDYHAVR